MGQAREFIQKSRQELYRNYARAPVVIAERKEKFAKSSSQSKIDSRRQPQQQHIPTVATGNPRFSDSNDQYDNVANAIGARSLNKPAHRPDSSGHSDHTDSRTKSAYSDMESPGQWPTDQRGREGT